MVEIILFVALVGLAVAHQRLYGRVSELERHVEFLAGADPEEARTPASAAGVGASRPDRAGTFGGEEPPPEPAAARSPLLVDVPGRPAASEPPATGRTPETLGHLFERLVGGRLLIWIGGIALAVAGVLLVRFSMQIGLITPAVQMILAALFGLLLLGAGEVARRWPGTTLDPRVAQALVGAGIVVLYATPYGSLILYGLVSKTVASALMVVVTAGALFLSLRHGPPTAALGLLGGFATPLLVGDPSATAVPLLTYIGLLDLALFVVAARRNWTWLAAAATLLSFGWTVPLIFATTAHATAAGFFILGLSVAASLARAGDGWQLAFLRPAAIGLLQLAMLVARSDLEPTAWALYGALSLACFFLAARKADYRPLPALALAAALVLLAVKAVGPDPLLATVGAGITLVFAGGSLPAAARRSRPLVPFLVACAAFAGPVLILRGLRPELLAPNAWAGLMAALSLGPLLLAWSRRSHTGDGASDRPLLVAAATAMLLVGIAASDLVSLEMLGPVWLLLALVAALAARRLDDSGLTGLAGLGAAIAVFWCADMVPGLWLTLSASLAGVPALGAHLPTITRMLEVLFLPAVLLGALWRAIPSHHPRLRTAILASAAAFLALSGYIAFKQIYGLRDSADFAARGFAERLLVTQFLFAAGWLVCSGRLPMRGLGAVQRWRVGTLLTALAAARLVWFDMLLHNPALVDQRVGDWPVLNLLAPAFLLSAFWLYKARRGADSDLRSGVWLILFLAALVAGVMLMVRQGFQGAILTAPRVLSSESYGYSLAGLLLSIALLLSGIRIPDKALRLAGLVLLTATILKVFLIDASALEGVLRILSFLGLGVALIGIGKLYTTVLEAEARRPSGKEEAT